MTNENATIIEQVDAPKLTKEEFKVFARTLKQVSNGGDLKFCMNNKTWTPEEFCTVLGRTDKALAAKVLAWRNASVAMFKHIEEHSEGKHVEQHQWLCVADAPKERA